MTGPFVACNHERAIHSHREANVFKRQSLLGFRAQFKAAVATTLAVPGGGGGAPHCCFSTFGAARAHQAVHSCAPIARLSPPPPLLLLLPKRSAERRPSLQHLGARGMIHGADAGRARYTYIYRVTGHWQAS